MQSRIVATMMTFAPSSTFGSLASTIERVAHPLAPLPENDGDRGLSELDSGSDDVSFYDIYRSPCRGIIKASNDELLDQNDLESLSDDDERNYIISYNSGGGITNPDKASDLYKSFSYYFDDMEYCGATFFGGCRFSDLDDLTSASLSSPTESFMNFTVTYDYEIHYINNRQTESLVSNDSEDNAAQSSFTNTNFFPIRSQREKHQPPDPIPALEAVETIVVEHLGEVVGLSRRGCDPSGRVSIGRPKQRNTYRHGFSDKDLNRILAISSKPKDVLDPDHANCIVPVASAIGTETDCMPVKGGIHVYVNTTDLGDDGDESLEDLELSIQSGFQRLIRFGMQNDLYVSDQEDEAEKEVLVKYVSFIGTRIVIENSGDGDSEDSSLNLLDGSIIGFEGIFESSANKRNVAGLVVTSIGLIVALLTIL